MILGFSFLLGWIIFYSLLLYSAKHQESSIEYTIFLLISSILGIIFTLYNISTTLIPFYGSFIGSTFLDICFDIISILSFVFLLLYAIQNRDHFENYLFICAVLFLISSTYFVIFSYLYTLLFISGVNLVNVLLLLFINTMISGILEICALIFLIIHGFKNEDRAMSIAGFLLASLIGISIILGIISVIFQIP